METFIGISIMLNCESNESEKVFPLRQKGETSTNKGSGGVHTLTPLNLYRRNFHISTAQTARLLKEYRVKYDLRTVAKIYTHTAENSCVSRLPGSMLLVCRDY